MTEIDLGADVVFKIKYGGKEFKLREPTVKEVQGFREKEQGAEFVTDLLANLGMPKDVVENMPVSKLKKLVEGIVEGLTEKK